MDLNPSQFRLLLAGAKVQRLLPFVTSRGYLADGCQTGSQALALMRQQPRHVLLAEIELEDMLLADLLPLVRSEELAGAVLLLDDPAKSGLIISQLIRGVDAYVATPPEELHLFRVIERHLLAQWAVTQMGRAAEEQREHQHLQEALKLERAKVAQLSIDFIALREQLQTALAKEWIAGGPLSDDDDHEPTDGAHTQPRETLVDHQAAMILRDQAPSDVDAAPHAEERTAPDGGEPEGGRDEVELQPNSGFGTQHPAPVPIDTEDGDASDLFLDVDSREGDSLDVASLDVPLRSAK